MSFLHLYARSLWQNIKQSIRQWVKPDNYSPALNAALDLSRSKSELMVENALLRQQLIIVQRETKRPKLTWRDQALIVFLTSRHLLPHYLRERRRRIIVEIGSRRVDYVGVMRHPSDQWTAQQLREATPFGEGPRFLIRDNDKKYGDSFKRVASEIKVLKIPYRAPRANAYCERFIGSLRRECLDHVIILNERHLHRIVKEYATYFNTDRPHQGIDQRIPGQPERPEPLESPPGNEKLVSRPVLNGLHHTYSWAATQSVGYSQAQRPTVH